MVLERCTNAVASPFGVTGAKYYPNVTVLYIYLILQMLLFLMMMTVMIMMIIMMMMMMMVMVMMMMMMMIKETYFQNPSHAIMQWFRRTR